MTDDALLHRFSAFVDLTDRERAAMRDMIGPERPFNAAEHIRSEGDEVASLFFLHEGWVFSGISHPNGSRQVVEVHRSGEVMGAPSLPFETAVESLVALTPARVSTIPLGKIGALFVEHPRLAAILYLKSQEERVTLMDRLAVGGQLSAKHSVAALLLLLIDGRLPPGGSDTRLHIPMTQAQIGDVLGLSVVHVNRVMCVLETEGLIRRDGPIAQTYELPDVPRLKELIGLPERVRRRNPTWLTLAK